MLENHISVHYHLEGAGVKNLLGLSFFRRPAAAWIFDIQFFSKTPVRVEVRGKYARLVRSLNNGNTCTIPKDHRCIAAPISYIKRGRLNLRANNQDGLVHSGLDELVSRTQRIYESGTSVPDIECAYIA